MLWTLDPIGMHTGRPRLFLELPNTWFAAEAKLLIGANRHFYNVPLIYHCFEVVPKQSLPELAQHHVPIR